jgi:predicted secreted hydrolase
MRCELLTAAAIVTAIATATATAISTPTSIPTSTSTATSTPTATATSAPIPTATWLQPRPDHRWEFPRDHWSKPGYRNEWWYFTGQLEPEDEPGRRFGFQLTFFRVGLAAALPPLDSGLATRGAVMAHLAVTDLARGTHRFSEVLYRAAPPLGGFGAFPDPLVAWSRAPAGSGGRWTLRWNGAAFDLEARDPAAGIGLRLETRPERPLAYQGPNGFSRKAAGEGFASLYYSFTRLAASGELEAGGERRRVRGRAWMDRELSSAQLAPGQVGWDWFALHLGDGRDLMLYVLRRSDRSADFRSATVVETDGTTRHLEADAWSVRETRRWRSPRTRADYPAGWEVELPAHGLRLSVEPLLADQENVATLAGLHYWEGAVKVLDAAGREVGRGYVELTGYGEGNRPPL